MEELKHLLGTLYSFHKFSRHIPPPCLTALSLTIFFTDLNHKHNTSPEEGLAAAGLFITRPVSAMAQRECSAGQTMDKLLNMCVPSKPDTHTKTACSAGQVLDKHSNKCIAIRKGTMAKKVCPTGQMWDELINSCFPRKTEIRAEPDRPIEPPLQPHVNQVRVMAPVPQANPMMVLSPALWIFVVLATVGSILALTLWFIIYRRETRHSNTSEEAEPGLEPLQKTEPLEVINPLPSERNGPAQVFQREAEASLSCLHLHLGTQTDSKWADGFIACRDIARHAGKEGGEAPSAYSMMREHKIPLPATELGGTALVTTKTV